MEHYHQIWSEVVSDKVKELRQRLAERLGCAILGMVDYSPNEAKPPSDVEYAAQEIQMRLDEHHNTIDFWGSDGHHEVIDDDWDADDGNEHWTS